MSKEKLQRESADINRARATWLIEWATEENNLSTYAQYVILASI